MAEFTKGDRVICIGIIPGSSTTEEMIGNKGTVLDYDRMPNVKMDNKSLHTSYNKQYHVFYQEELERTDGS